jgi:hypothetical protein
MKHMRTRSIYVRRRWVELLDRAVEFEAEKSGEEPSISRTLEAAVRAYVEPRERHRRWRRDVEEACNALYERRHRDGNPHDDMCVDACVHDAKRAALMMQRHRDGEPVSDDMMAAAGWTPTADGHEFTGLHTERAVTAKARLDEGRGPQPQW